MLVSINFTLGGSICTIIDLKGHESSNIPEGRDFPKTRKRAHSERVDVTIFFTISHAQLKDTAPPPHPRVRPAIRVGGGVFFVVVVVVCVSSADAHRYAGEPPST